MHALDNAIWTALNTRQRALAREHGQARAFLPDVSILAGCEDGGGIAFMDLAAVVDAECGLILEEVTTPPEPWEVVRVTPVTQMVHEHAQRLAIAPDPPAGGRPPAIALTADDVPEMLALTALTNPGPFAARTLELGMYLGMRVAGRLAAMAGERLRVPGFVEVSGVCTHPDFAGRGYATLLVAQIAARIREQGETPFLHVRSDYAPAIRVYERLGFVRRADLQYVVLRRH